MHLFFPRLVALGSVFCSRFLFHAHSGVYLGGVSLLCLVGVFVPCVFVFMPRSFLVVVLTLTGTEGEERDGAEAR